MIRAVWGRLPAAMVLVAIIFAMFGAGVAQAQSGAIFQQPDTYQSLSGAQVPAEVAHFIGLDNVTGKACLIGATSTCQLPGTSTSLQAGSQVQTADGVGNITRPSAFSLSGGTPIEYQSVTLTTSSTTAGPLNAEGFGGLNHTLTSNASASGSVTLEYNPSFNPSTPTTGWIAQTDCVAKTSTAISSGVVTLSASMTGATFYCPNEGPQRLHFTTATAGTVTDTPFTIGAQLVNVGVPMFAPPAAIALGATRISADGQGTQISLGGFVPLYSTTPGDTLNGKPFPAGGLGLCGSGTVTDLGNSTSSGAASLYAGPGSGSATSIGIGHIYNASSPVNPFGCDTTVSPPALTAKQGYDTTNSLWYYWALSANSGLNTQGYPDGYLTPNYGFLVVVRAKQPANLPPSATMCPWFAPVWLENNANIVSGGSGQSMFPLKPSTMGYDEIDGPEFCISAPYGGSILNNLYILTWHDWSLLQAFGAALPGQPQTPAGSSRQVQSPTQTFNQGDGQFHDYAILVTLNYVVWFIDYVEVARWLKVENRTNLGRWSIKIDNALFVTPSSTANTIQTEIQSVKVYGCPQANACSYPVN